MRITKIFIFSMIIISCCLNTSHALTTEQHSKFLEREDYKLSYDFFQDELKNIEKLLSIQKYKNLSTDIIKDIDLEVKYINETHPFYDKERMYAIIFASKALQLKWLGDFLKENKNYTQQQFESFLKGINITNVYNFIAKTMEVPDDISIVNELPVQCKYEKTFQIGKNIWLLQASGSILFLHMIRHSFHL